MTTENSLTNLPAGCGALTGNIQDNGNPLDTGIASGYINNYLAGVNDIGDHNYGYLFGLNKINDFLTAIAAFNAAGPTQPIQGVRVYLGRKTPTGGVAIPMEKIMDTLFLIPVLADGHDVPFVHLVGGTIILGDPRPCPTLCLSLSFLQE